MRELQPCNIIPCLGYNFSYPLNKGASTEIRSQCRFFDHSHPLYAILETSDYHCAGGDRVKFLKCFI